MRRIITALLLAPLLLLAACSSSDTPPPSVVAMHLRSAEASATQLGEYGSIGRGKALAAAQLISNWDYKQAIELLVSMRPQGCAMLPPGPLDAPPNTGSSYSNQQAGLQRAHCHAVSNLVDATIVLLYGPDGNRHRKAYLQALALAEEYGRHAAAMHMLAASAAAAARTREAK